MAKSGKSYVLLSLMLLNKEIKHPFLKIKSYGNGSIIYNSAIISDYIKTNILVIPHHLFFQWNRYIEKYFKNIDKKDFNYKVVLKNNELNDLTLNINKIKEYDLLVLNDKNYKKFILITNINNIKFNRIIFDEADSLRLPQLDIESNTKAKFRWFVSSSFINILYPSKYILYSHKLGKMIYKSYGMYPNYYVDLIESIRNQINKNILKLIIVKNDDDYIRSSIMNGSGVSISLVGEYIIECKDPRIAKLLNGIVPKEVMNYINLGKIEKAKEYFDKKQIYSEEKIIKIILNNNKENIKDSVKDNIKDRIKNNKCSICYSDCNNDKCVVSCCSNIFCFVCINKWLGRENNQLLNNGTCPLCNMKLSDKNLFMINNKKNDDNFSIIDMYKTYDIKQVNKEFNKIENLRILLNSKKEEKNIKCDKFRVVIYIDNLTEDDEMCQMIFDILIELNLTWKFLKGNKYVIKNILQLYNSGITNVLILNCENNGCGLDLSNTDYAFFINRNCNQLEEQIICRMNNMKRENELEVYYLLNKNEIEYMDKEK
jgi:hypothetical protein